MHNELTDDQVQALVSLRDCGILYGSPMSAVTERFGPLVRRGLVDGDFKRGRMDYRLSLAGRLELAARGLA